MKQIQDKLNIYDFGRELLKINDLDPVYVILYEAKLEKSLLERWLLAYFCFYHVGTASWIAQSCIGEKYYLDTNYWEHMFLAAGSKDYPRSSERRHFRGQQAIEAVSWLSKRGIKQLFDGFKGLTTAAQVMTYVKTWKRFGSWIAFKVADILERIGYMTVEFTLDEVMYESPQKAAEMLWANEKDDEEFIPSTVGEWAITNVLTELGDEYRAPPRYERRLNMQEAETILCKWKSYMNGHYHIGEDVEAVRNGLLRFAKCPISQRLLRGGKKGGLW